MSSFQFIAQNRLQPNMKENEAFNFTEQAPPAVDLEFKKQRAAYLAQRNARKQQAQALLKRDRAHSTSSDEDLPSAKKTLPKFKAQPKPEDTLSNSSHNSPQKIEEKNFQAERQKYKAERAARRHQVAKNKQVEFGPSSSSDDGIPIYKPKINIVESTTKKQAATLFRPSALKEELDTNPFVALSITRTVEKSKSQNLHSSVKLKQSPPEKKSQRERYEIQVPSKKGVNIWLEQYLQFKQTSVQVGERSVPLYDLTKIKLFFIRTQSGNYKMKVTYKTEDIFFAVDHKKLNQLCLDHYYYFFAKIITLRLQLMGKKLTQNTKPKLGLSEQQLKGAQITGKVRKSSFFGGWEESIGVVNQSGLCIFKEGKQKPVLTIGYNTIRELWTRFDFDNENLIIKFLHNSSKVELSIPFENYLSRDNWLYHIYNLANK